MVQLISKSFKIEQFPLLKYSKKPLSLMFWHDLKHKFDKFFKYFDPNNDYKVAFVINVDRRSRVVNAAIFGVEKYFWNPLSFIRWQRANFNVLNPFRWFESAIANSTEFEHSVQLKSRYYTCLTIIDFNIFWNGYYLNDDPDMFKYLMFCILKFLDIFYKQRSRVIQFKLIFDKFIAYSD